MILISGVLLTVIGIICLICRKTMLGVLIGAHLVTLGCTLQFVLAGASVGETVDSIIFGLFIVLIGISQLVVGYSLSMRLFYISGDNGLSKIRNLRH